MLFRDDCRVGETGHVAATNRMGQRLNAQPVSVREYGAACDGKTDDTAAIQKALDSEAYIILPGVCRATSPLNLTNRALTLAGKPGAGILIDHPGIGLDCTGGEIALHDLSIRGSAAGPQVGTYHARSTTRTGAGCRYERVTISGAFRLGCILGICNELTYLHDVYLYPTPSGVIRFGLYTAAVNTWGVASPFVPLSDVVTNSTNWYRLVRCVCVGAANFIPLHFGYMANGITIDGGYIASSGPAYVQLDDNHYMASLRGMTFEQAATDAIRITTGGKAAATVDTLTLADLGAAAHSSYFIQADDGVTVEGLRVDNCRGAGGMRFDRLHYPDIGKWWTNPARATITAAENIGGRVMTP